MISLDRFGLSSIRGARRSSPRTRNTATEVQREEHHNALDGKVLQKTPVLAMAGKASPVAKLSPE
jgi:hypothetical protein